MTRVSHAPPSLGAPGPGARAPHPLQAPQALCKGGRTSLQRAEGSAKLGGGLRGALAGSEGCRDPPCLPPQGYKPPRSLLWQGTPFPPGLELIPGVPQPLAPQGDGGPVPPAPRALQGGGPGAGSPGRRGKARSPPASLPMRHAGLALAPALALAAGRRRRLSRASHSHSHAWQGGEP